MLIPQQAVSVVPYQKHSRNPLVIIDQSTNKHVNAAVALEKIDDFFLFCYL